MGTSCVDTYAAMAVYQPLMCKLTRRHRRQASSHFCSVVPLKFFVHLKKLKIYLAH
ncbi:hypothetical protein METHPM2_700007 [Pseudomonas sp. PM2]